jgi:hypothetical protein
LPIQAGPIKPLIFAIALWLEKSGSSRSDYTRLREILAMNHTLLGNEGLFEMPFKLDTLKRLVRRHLPMLRLLRKAVKVTFKKQPSLPARQKQMHIERMTWLYWYDPIDLVSNILSATMLTDKMYFGMAHIVDEPTEYYHARAWGASNIATSGEYVRSNVGHVIFVGDLVRFDPTVSEKGFSRGRVIFVGYESGRHAERSRVF